jgi:hypothetical protein
MTGISNKPSIPILASLFQCSSSFTEASLPDRKLGASGPSVDKLLDIHRNGLCKNAAFCRLQNLVQICHGRDTGVNTGLYRVQADDFSSVNRLIHRKCQLLTLLLSLYTYFACKPETAKAAAHKNFFSLFSGIVGLKPRSGITQACRHPGQSNCAASCWSGSTIDLAAVSAGRGTVDKPMHIHRSECAEAVLFDHARNLYTFGASAIHALFSTSKRR